MKEIAKQLCFTLSNSRFHIHYHKMEAIQRKTISCVCWGKIVYLSAGWLNCNIFNIHSDTSQSARVDTPISWLFLYVLGHIVAQSCSALCDSMDCTVHEFLQARILEWVTIPFSKGSSQPRAHPLLPPSPPAFTLSQHQGLFQ